MCWSRDSGLRNLFLDKIYMTTASIAIIATPIVLMIIPSSTIPLYLSPLWTHILTSNSHKQHKTNTNASKVITCYIAKCWTCTIWHTRYLVVLLLYFSMLRWHKLTKTQLSDKNVGSDWTFRYMEKLECI